jgi:hypothetical protein
MPDMAATLPVQAARNKPKLLDQVRDVIRRKHFSIRTHPPSRCYGAAGIQRRTLNYKKLLRPGILISFVIFCSKLLALD